MITERSLDDRFNFHPARDDETKQRHERVREICKQAARDLLNVMGEASREQSTAITKLEEAMFWANAAVARPQSH